MLRPVLTVPPAVPLVSLGDIKAHCRVDDTDSDILLQLLVQAATDHLDGWSGILGRCLVNQTWRVDCSDWPFGDLRLPFPNVSSVSVAYFDADNAAQTLASTKYELLEDARGAFIRWTDTMDSPSVYDDRSDGVQVTLVAGYGAAATAVPQAIVHAAMMHAGHLFENREAVAEGAMAPLPLAHEALIAPYRRIHL